MKVKNKNKLICLLFTSACCVANVSAQVPSQIASRYSNQIDWSYSDTFNTSSLNTGKWTYFRGNGTPVENFVFRKTENGTGFMDIAGYSTGRSAGISAKAARQYGFYRFRWRAVGLDKDVLTAWIPAIWGAAQNFGQENRILRPFPERRLELDAMELFSHPRSSGLQTAWRCQGLAWTGRHPNNTLEEVALTDNKVDFGNWVTLGIEYTPNFLRLWQLRSNGWVAIQTRFFTGRTSRTTMDRRHRTPQYWILRNSTFRGGERPTPGMRFQIDYFYYYRMR